MNMHIFRYPPPATRIAIQCAVNEPPDSGRAAPYFATRSPPPPTAIPHHILLHHIMPPLLPPSISPTPPPCVQEFEANREEIKNRNSEEYNVLKIQLEVREARGGGRGER